MRSLKEGVMMDLAAGGKEKKIAPMNFARYGFHLVSVKEHLYAIGGLETGQSMERYDPKENQWTLMPEMQEGRAWAGCAVVEDRIVVAGGRDSMEIYDTNTGTWLQGIPKMPKIRSSLCCAMLNKELYVLGRERVV